MKKELWMTLSDDTQIQIVDPDEVKTEHDIDFTEGSNYMHRSYIPHGEIWISTAQSIPSRYYTLCHEMKEVPLLIMGMPYDKAHEIAAQFELGLRKDGVFDNKAE